MPSVKTQSKTSHSIVSLVAERVRTSDNVLVALSKDPSVDELSAALGLTFILDKLGKHATAIFSGAVPNAIEFLEPEKTFETNTNSLQDFIIALDKEKADHLRYKIDGDFVKVYITPYKTTIDESDMQFSHGDYNVDLVISLNVDSSDDLDAALSEYGRIMHDASSINISAQTPGSFGDLEWGDEKASSVSEMIYKLSEEIRDKDQTLIDKSTATALLAGIVAATNRFSNEHTHPSTMEIAGKLMVAGADQQLISSSIPVDILTDNVVDANEDAETAEPEKIPAGPLAEAMEEAKEDVKEEPGKEEEAPAEEEDKEEPQETPAAKPAKAEEAPAEVPSDSLNVHHGAVDFNVDESGQESFADEAPAEEPAKAEEAPAAEPAKEEAPAAPIIPQQPQEETINPITSNPIPPVDFQTIEENSAATPTEQAAATAKLEEMVAASPLATAADDTPVMQELRETPSVSGGMKNITPPSEALAPPTIPKDYASMMEAELQAPTPPAPAPAPAPAPVPEPVVTAPEPAIAAPVPESMPVLDATPLPAAAPAEPVVNNEYVAPPLPMPDASTVLPPPPMPFDPSAAPLAPSPEAMSALDTTPLPPQTAQDYAAQLQQDNPIMASPEDMVAMPQVEPVMPAVPMAAPAETPVSAQQVNPVMQDQVYPADPSAFQIPGM